MINMLKFSSDRFSPELLTTVAREIARRMRKQTPTYLILDRYLIWVDHRTGKCLWDIIIEVVGYEPKQDKGHVDVECLNWDDIPGEAVRAILKLHGKEDPDA